MRIFQQKIKKLKELNSALSTENERLEEVLKTFQHCDLCDKHFDEKNSPRHHIQVSHRVEDFRCNNCEKYLETNSLIQQHIEY